jgi:hypothetical protein
MHLIARVQRTGRFSQRSSHFFEACADCDYGGLNNSEPGRALDWPSCVPVAHWIEHRPSKPE